MIQLPAETAVILDETHLGPIDETSEAGRSLAALTELSVSQELAYDFRFYAMKYASNFPVFLLSSSGAASAVDPSCWLPVHPAAATAAAAAASPCSELGLVECRRYLAGAAAMPPAPFAAGVAEVAENDFVRLRQTSVPPGADTQPTISAKDFHRWLTLSRLLAASHGSSEVSRGHWDRALEMEAARRSRCHAASRLAPTPGTAFASPAGTHPTMPPPPHAPPPMAVSPSFTPSTGPLAMGDDE